MTIEEDLANWLADRPVWQQRLVAEMCKGVQPDDTTVKQISDSLVDRQVGPTVTVKATDIPGAAVAGGRVLLREVGVGAAINNLADGERLKFAPTGLTIVYGFNGSGKSGYARLLRRSVNARIDVEIHRDVFDQDANKAQEAEVGYDVDGGATKVWRMGEALSAELAQVRFYDTVCGRAYVDLASEAVYRPSALVFLEVLARITDRVINDLRQRLAVVDGVQRSLPLIAPETTAAGFIASLTAETTAEQIAMATTASKELDEQLAGKLGELARAGKLGELARLEASNPESERNRLVALAAALVRLAGHCREVEARVGSTARRTIEDTLRRAIDLRRAAELASQQTFESEPLRGVGSGAWRALWDAAARYSESEAYRDQQFPVTGVEAHCVLCQQQLAPSSADRLQSFSAFMANRTEHDAAAAERAVVGQREPLEWVRRLRDLLQPDLAAVADSIPALATAVSNWLGSANGTAEDLLNGLAGSALPSTDLPLPPPIGELEQHAESVKLRAAGIDPTSYMQTVADLRRDVSELEGQRSLVEATDAINAEVERLKERRRLDDARRSLETSSITRMASKLTEAYVTDAVASQFATEVERYGLQRVVMRKAGSSKGVVVLKPAFEGVTRPPPIRDVLSEGEQTALGLAGFFTELQFEQTKSAVVLDDPVSSFDHANRGRVAKRIIELAADRQVVVFTHDISFVAELKRLAGADGVATTDRGISRRGTKPGFCVESHPWTAKDVNVRIHFLSIQLQALKRDQPDLLDFEYEARASEFAGHLSETWERMINVEVACAVVDPVKLEVNPRKLRALVFFDENDNDEFQTCYGQTSAWARRHDNHPDRIYTAPTIEELEKALETLKGWKARIHGYQKK
ncbi:energy-coupling factor transporter ATP-binding protein EcfA2 [Kribbella aluminosa]|uniref:Energy-coupling factor transporter ATP-binding protein EcfA2 n=1 Tax=Kribbella aluminosa TaxID=416017 RepID=A0ABS4UNR0_9ACTN|nr:AAA family ATPase [Kribbella aluminosa]MBP2353199.1 energy-coupling factor transporter ATP-binding protein EcfA2 [Kribbella aluminosa]